MDDFDDDLHPDLTPLIDVIFMLVIFFIMTMSFTLPTVDFQLPTSDTAQHQQDRQASIAVLVNRQGQYFCAGQQVSRAELIDMLRKADSPAVELSIAHDAPAQFIIDIADLAREYAGGRLSIATIRSEDDGGLQP